MMTYELFIDIVLGGAAAGLACVAGFIPVVIFLRCVDYFWETR